MNSMLIKIKQILLLVLYLQEIQTLLDPFKLHLLQLQQVPRKEQLFLLQLQLLLKELKSEQLVLLDLEVIQAFLEVVQSEDGGDGFEFLDATINHLVLDFAVDGFGFGDTGDNVSFIIYHKFNNLFF